MDGGLDEFHVAREGEGGARPCRVRLNIAVKFFPLGTLFDRECDTLIWGLSEFILVRDIYKCKKY
jgi:hypothetical protein